mmetsp:Transcript_33299/g.87638  ORF Transcript_33299/g.87638 Transcript_33299/m.87638 type:complete len:224 (+) Transcript_33299:304-975(+)|eukprot:CAMPEP_0115856396 /NCGR_PEP_ID=MMETSP0287-20121206/15031_1 /TAXON_ID=412157 /ORGANISM="Chrysochromulina rotalis, Strain UIO044" /LENGTH=223 /DNA_ID=CAMNT_0003310569 /DNA_START=228 /DNA_END=899 /DNA_ORIENTATION=-
METSGVWVWYISMRAAASSGIIQTWAAERRDAPFVDRGCVVHLSKTMTRPSRVLLWQLIDADMSRASAGDDGTNVPLGAHACMASGSIGPHGSPVRIRLAGGGGAAQEQHRDCHRCGIVATECGGRHASEGDKACQDVADAASTGTATALTWATAAAAARIAALGCLLKHVVAAAAPAEAVAAPAEAGHAGSTGHFAAEPFDACKKFGRRVLAPAARAPARAI